MSETAPKTRMWIMSESLYDSGQAAKFCIDNPRQIPRIGEFIDSDEAGGWVTHVQYYYSKVPKSEFDTVVNVHCSKERP